MLVLLKTDKRSNSKICLSPAGLNHPTDAG